MQTEEGVSHSNLDELIQVKIPALAGRARVKNLLILETIAAEGPLLKYDVYKRLKRRKITEYSTVTRRIDFLKRKGYLGEAGKRVTERGKQKAETMYGLTWKGFIASFAGNKIRENALQVIERNPLLNVPEKEFVLLVLREALNSKEIQKITALLLYGCLRIIPNLESVREGDLWLWVFQGLKEMPSDYLKITDVPEQKKDLTKLLDNPRILLYVKTRILPLVSEWKRNMRAILGVFEVFDQMGVFIKELNPDDKPSEKLKEYIESKKIEKKLTQIVGSQN